MAMQEQAAPGISDEAVRAKTGRTWAQWFAILDRAKAQNLPHKEIAEFLNGKHGVPPWWSQMVTVGYERARGLRVRHETTTGFSVSISKTIAAELPKLYAATVDMKKRKGWFPAGEFVSSSATAGKYFRGSWNGSARLEINFYAKGEDKAQINVQVNKLGTEKDVARERSNWKSALEKLKTSLEN